MRLYDADSGSVMLEGGDIRDLKLESLREAVAVVPQVRRAASVSPYLRASFLCIEDYLSAEIYCWFGTHGRTRFSSTTRSPGTSSTAGL
jgi:hypothetical protein